MEPTYWGQRRHESRREPTGEEKRAGSTQKGSQMKVHSIQEEDYTAVKPVALQFCTLHINNMKFKFKSLVTENDYLCSGVLDK